MSVMIQRVTAALRKRLGPNVPATYLAWAARDAIEAMREPTEAMLTVGGEVVPGYLDGIPGERPEHAGDVFRAMIDAALEEKA